MARAHNRVGKDLCKDRRADDACGVRTMLFGTIAVVATACMALK